MDQATADLNNVALSYFERGDLKKALELFRSALRQTMGPLRPSPPPAAAPPRMYAPRSNSPNGSGPNHRSNSSATAPPHQAKPIAELSNVATPFIHTQGFGIVGNPGAYSPDPLINTTVVSSIVIFNLAVVYHIKGIHEKALNDTRLVKAHSLYLKSHMLLRDAGVSFGSTGNAVVDLLSMAVSNNLAHVCYELSDFAQSRLHFDGLIRFALTVVPARYGDPHVGSVMDQQKSNFLLNAIILHQPSLAPAA